MLIIGRKSWEKEQQHCTIPYSANSPTLSMSVFWQLCHRWSILLYYQRCHNISSNSPIHWSKNCSRDPKHHSTMDSIQTCPYGRTTVLWSGSLLFSSCKRAWYNYLWNNWFRRTVYKFIRYKFNRIAFSSRDRPHASTGYCTYFYSPVLLLY